MLLTLKPPVCIRQPPNALLAVNASLTNTCCWRQPRSHFNTRHVACTAIAAEDSTASMDNEQEVEWVEIGRISVQHGIRGEVKVQPMTDFAPQRLGKAGTRYAVNCELHTWIIKPAHTHDSVDENTQVHAAPQGTPAPCPTSTITSDLAVWPQHHIQGVPVCACAGVDDVCFRHCGAHHLVKNYLHVHMHAYSQTKHIPQGHDMWLVKLEGYDTPEAVRELRNYTLLIREDDRDPDEDLEDDDEFYVQVDCVWG